MAKYVSSSLLHVLLEIRNKLYWNIETSRKFYIKEIYLIWIFPTYFLPLYFLNFINVLHKQKQFYESQMLNHC